MEQANIQAGDGCAARSGQPCDFSSIGRFEDRSGRVGAAEVFRCRHCGHGITMPRLNDVGFLYAGRESQDYQPNTAGLSAIIKDAAFALQARKLIRQLPGRPRSVLDFGCGSGQFTRILGQNLGGADVIGSDFHGEPPAALGKLGYVAMKDLKGRQFDLVTAMHVLEHDDRPGELLATLKSLVAPGGTLVVEVPNADCLWGKWLGTNWDAWYVPYHRTHFTRRSLEHQLQRIGMAPTAIYGVTVPTMGRSLANCFGSRNNLFWLVCGIALHPLQWLVEKVSREPSAIRVVIGG